MLKNEEIIEELTNKEVDFKKLSYRRVSSLTTQEKKEYYIKLKEFYLSSSFDEDKLKFDERKYLMVSHVIMPLFNMLFKTKVINPEMIPTKDKIGTIFVANHLGSLDQFPIISAVGINRPLHTMISSTLLNLKRGYLYKNVGCITMDMKDLRSQLRGMEEATNILLRGRDVLIFPEGTRNTTEKLILDFKLGPVSLAQETGAKIVPIAVNNDYKIGENYLYVRCGEPITIGVDDNLVEENEKLRNSVVNLIWENMELEKENRKSILREEVIMDHEVKKLKLEKQREKINNRKR